MTLSTFLVLLFLVIASMAQPSVPALKVSMPPSSMQYVANLIQPLLVQKLQMASLPSFSEQIGTPIGDVQLDVSSCQFTSVQIGQLSVGPYQSPSNDELGVGVSVDNLALTCNWHYRKVHWPHISDGGSADIGFASTAIVSIVQLFNQGGHAGVTAKLCQIDIGQFSLHLHGGASWLYNLFIGALKGKIESAITNAVDQTICTEIDQKLNAAFAALPTELPFGPELGVDYALMASPVVDATDGIVLPCLGEFYDQSDPNALDPCAGQPVPNSVVSNRMIQFVVGSCAVDSIGYALQNAGLLSLLVDNADLPPNFGISLTTDYFEFIIPQLYNKYPDKNMTALVYTPKQPHLVVSNNVVLVKALVYMNVSVLAPQPVPAFTMASTLTVNATVALNGTTLVPTLGWVAGQSAVISSNFGTGWESLVAPLLTDAIRYVALPIANQQLASGFAIPTSGKMKLNNPVVQISNNLLVVASDFTLHL
jgi:lipopolysaccharide-binding protein